MNWKAKAITALERITEYKPLIKVETFVLGAINRLSEAPKVETKEPEAIKKEELV